MNAANLEQVPVLASAITPQHLPVIDGDVHEIVTIDPLGRTLVIVHTPDLLANVAIEELEVGRHEPVPCVRRADWIAAGGAR